MATKKKHVYTQRTPHGNYEILAVRFRADYPLIAKVINEIDAMGIKPREFFTMLLLEHFERKEKSRRD